MKRITRLMLAAGLATFGGSSLKAQDAVTMQTCEYWFDYDFQNRQSVSVGADGIFQQQYDVEAMPRGLHSIGLRFADSKGRWGAPLVRHFVIPTLPAQTYDDNRIVGMEYWLDYDFDHRQTLESTNGTAALSLDMSALAPGLHSIAYRAVDSRGLYLSPMLKHFVVPSLPEPQATGIVAYEYWFNKGPRKRVAVEAQRELTLDHLAIEVKDVVPNAITADYVFSVSEKMAYCADDVTFGIQAFDDAGHPSSAVMSERFAYDVPVNPHFITLEDQVPVDFSAPSVGEIQGFKVLPEKDGELDFTLNGSGQLDFYDADGQALESAKTVDDQSALVTYTVKSSASTLYALLWDVPQVVENMQMVCTHHQSSGISQMTMDGGLRILSEKGTLTIAVPEDGVLRVLTSGGTEVYHRHVTQGTQTLRLSAGVYIVAFNGTRSKVMVR